jgi:hypothetical protein
VDELAAEVAGASKEQTQGIEQVNVAVSQMDKGTQSNAASAEESASAAEELNAQAESLKDSVASLLQLVNGQSTIYSRTAKISVNRPKRVEQKTALNAPARGASNGADRPPRQIQPESAPLAIVGRTGQGIPMEGDFRDF